MLQRFLEQIGEERSRLLIHVEVENQYKTTRERAFGLLSAATSLETLNIHCRKRFEQPLAFASTIFPVVRAICLSGRSRESALGVVVCNTGLYGYCDKHGPYGYWARDTDVCQKKKDAYAKIHNEVMELLGKMLDEAEERRTRAAEKKKNKKVAGGSESTTRAGRKTKAVNYADDDSEDDYVD